MRYMMLIHHDETALASASFKQLAADYAAFTEALAKAGGESGVRLQQSAAATTIRVSGGKTEILDGPYADTKEQLGGYYFIEAPDLDGAIAWALRCPSIRYGSVEIRPVMQAEGGGK